MPFGGLSPFDARNVDYAAWIKMARERLELLAQQRNAIDIEMAALEQGIRTFEPMVGATTVRFGAGGGSFNYPHIQEIGFTNAVRQIFRDNPEKVLEPVEVRDLMLLYGFDFGERKNAMANIHEIIRRLVASGEIEPVGQGFRLVPTQTGFTDNPLRGKTIR